METKPSSQQARELLVKGRRVARRNVKQFLARAQAARTAPPPARPAAVPRQAEPVLPPSAALRHNGFTVYRALFTPSECAAFAAALKAEAGIETGTKYMKVDAVNAFATAREILFEGRILDAVRSALGEQPRFLQVGDLHYLHDTAGWHRDSVHRAHDASEAPDWRPDAPPFGVVKAILYMETQNAAMGIMPGSHATPIEMDHDRVKGIEAAGRQRVIDHGENPNLLLSDEQRAIPLMWHAQVGDVLVFDERLYHAGRRVDHGVVSANRAAPKFTLSMVFGRDNEHSERMYSYFRYVRDELAYRDLSPAFVSELARRDLVLERGWGDFYREHPEDLRHVHLPKPSRLPALLAEYGATPRSA